MALPAGEIMQMSQDGRRAAVNTLLYFYISGLVGWSVGWIVSVASVKTLLELGLLFYALEKEWRTGYVLNLAAGRKRDGHAKSHQEF